MKKLLDTLPEQLAPEARLSDDDATIALEPPDFDDVIRPFVEQELLVAQRTHASHFGRNLDMAPHLLWTFGPQHRDLPFPMQLRCELEGDRFRAVDVEVGWLHQGLERALEHATPETGFALIAQTQSENSIAAELCYAGAVEELYGITDLVPAGAQRWRVVALEIARSLAHVEVIGTLARAHGSQRQQASLTQAKEQLRSLLGQVVSAGGTPVFRCIGGVSRWPTRELISELQRALPDAVSLAHGAAAAMGQSAAFIDALSGLAPIDRADAVERGLSGPLLRASGVFDDLRVRYPYFAYNTFAPRVVTRESGDALARFRVRADEMSQSVALSLRALSKLKANGDTKTAALPDDALEQTLPPGRATFSVEAPSGELSVSLVCGADGPQRVRFRGPSFALAQALDTLLVGRRVDEAVTVMENLGMVGTEVDR